MQQEGIYRVASVANWCGKPCSSLCRAPRGQAGATGGRAGGGPSTGKAVGWRWPRCLLCGEAVTPGCGQGARWKLERDGVHTGGGAISGSGAAPLSL